MAGNGLNKVLMIGNLVRDPELRYLPNGTPKAELRLATSRTYTTNGEKREDTCFVDVIAWSRTAETVNQYLKKGRKIFVEGRLDYQEWEGQDGSKRSKHAIVADRVMFLDSAGGGPSGDVDEAGGQSGYSRPARNAYQSPLASGQPNAPRPAAAAPAAAPGVSQAEIGLSAQSAPQGMSNALNIADDDIPF